MTGVGSGKLFLSLTPRGRSVAAAAQGLGVHTLPRVRANSPRFIEHHLAIGDTRIALELAADRSPLFAISEWCGDRQLVITVIEAGKANVVLVPDSSFNLLVAGRRGSQLLLEQDTGSLTNRPRMKARLLGYLRHARSAQVLVLFVTTTEERVTALAKLTADAGKADGLDARVVWFATNQRVRLGDPLHERIWQVPGVLAPVAIADILGTGASVPSGGLLA